MAEVNLTLYKKNGVGTDELNPKSIASQIKMNDAGGTASNVQSEIETLRGLIPAVGGMVFKGVLDATHVLPTTDYKAGWAYVVKLAGTYASKVCEVGDMVICVKDHAAGTASDDDWNVVQANIKAGYKTVKVGTTSVTASTVEDTIEFTTTAGTSDLTFTGDATNKKINFEIQRDACTVSSLASVPANLKDGGLILLVTP